MIATGNHCDYKIRCALQHAPTISTVVRLMKGAVSKQAGWSVWQKGFYDHVIRGEQDYLDVWNYIDGNPGRWTEDRLFVAGDQ
jgi:hypothetical protein